MTPRLALTLLLPLAACAANPNPTLPDDPAAPDPPEASGDTLYGADLPATKEIETSTEGEPVTLAARLVRETDFKIPFATYAPEGVEYRRRDDGTAVFSTGGNPDFQATLTVAVVHDPSRFLDLEAYARGLLSAEERVEPYESREPWVEAAFTFFSGDEMGSLRIGRRGEHVVYALDALPPEMGDGWATLSQALLSEWLWLDTGRGL